MRTTRKDITFLHPFILEGVDGEVPAGTYAVDVDEEQIEGLSFLAYQRISTTLYVPLEASSTSVQAIRVDPLELDAAQKGQTRATGHKRTSGGS